MASVGSFISANISVISYNMHGYNQGMPSLRDLIETMQPDVFLLREHWLTPANLNKFSVDFNGYYCFGSSAMLDAVAVGPLYGRPYGGIMILIKNDLMSICECITTADRYAIAKIGDLSLINVYLPCTGTSGRQQICNDILNEISVWRLKYADCACIIGGDFNVNLDKNCDISRFLNNYLLVNNFIRSDVIFRDTCQYTYINESLICFSKIDYLVCNEQF
jgi:exonuclease III